MSKVLVRKQLFDPKQTANNMATVSDLSNSGTIEQLGLLNLLSGPQKPLAPAAAEKLGYDMDSKQYKRLRMGERIGQGIAGAYGGFRALDALASGRSPTSAAGAGAGAYGSVVPIASRVGVRAASRGMKPAEPEPEPKKVAVTPPVPEKIEYNPVFDPVTFGQMERGRADTIQNRFPPTKIAVPPTKIAVPPTNIAVVAPSPLEVKEHENLQDVNGMRQTVFPPKNAGLAQPAREIKVAQPTVAMNPQEKTMLSYGAQIKPAEGFKTTTTQPQQGQFTAENKKELSSGPFGTKLDNFLDNEEREKRLEQARKDQSEQSSNVLPSSDIDGI